MCDDLVNGSIRSRLSQWFCLGNAVYLWASNEVIEEGMVFLPEESDGQRLVGYSPWGHKESDMTEETWHARKRK